VHVFNIRVQNQIDRNKRAR